MTELNKDDLKTLYEAIQRIHQTIHCTLCQKLPTKTIAGRCGHPFCKNCIEKILNTKKAVCSICKTVLIRSSISPVESIDKIRKDLESLSEAIEKDLDAAFPQIEQNRKKKFDNPTQASGSNLSTDKIIVLISGSQNNTDFLKRSLFEDEKQNINNNNNDNDREERKAAKEIERRLSIDSIETIKIQKNNRIVKKNEKDIFPTPSNPKATIVANQISEEPVFTTDDSLSNKIGTIGCKEKVEDWLNSDKFEEDIGKVEEEGSDGFEENVNLVSNPSPSTTSEILQSFSQTKPNDYSAESNSRDSKTPRKNDNTSKNSDHSENRKFQSFTFEATNGRKKSISSSNAVSREDELFDELKRTSVEDEIEKKRLRVNSVQTDSSWSELEKFKKETKAKVRKRKRLNVSIERPRPTLQSSEIEESMESRETGIDKSGDRSDRESKSNEEVIELGEESSSKKRRKPCLISSKILEPSEMIDVTKLNRRQVREIIGDPNHNVSGNSTNENLETSSNELKKSAELFLSRSGEYRRNDNMELEETEEDPKSNFQDNLRPESKGSNNPNESRSGSRLSYKSPGRPVSEKFRLSTGRRSATPQLAKADEGGEEKIQLKKDSPVRVSNDSIRNKLSLRRLSSGSSRITDAESVRSTSYVSFKKIGKLSKQRNKIKFIWLGSMRSRKTTISTRSVGIQTSPRPLANFQLNMKNISSNEESLSQHIIIPETRTASAVSSDLKQIEEGEEERGQEITAADNKSSEIITRNNTSERESDRVNKVILLSPEKDSQLKFLATKSPSINRIIRIDSDDSIRLINKSNDNTPMRKLNSSVNESLETPLPEEFSRAVKKRAEKLILTDSEDQDTPQDSFGKFERRNIDELSSRKGVSSTSTSCVSKTLSNLSNLNKKSDEIEAEKVRGVIIIAEESPAVESGGNNSEKRSSPVSPKRKKYSKESLEKGKSSSSFNQMSGSYCDISSESSDAETVLIKKSKNDNDDEDANKRSEDSEPWIIPARHKIVRKLKYSQESGLNTNDPEAGKSEKHSEEEKQQAAAGSDNEKKKPDRGGRETEKKTFQRIRRIPSTDSENDDLLLVSLTTKQSSSNSQIITRSGISREISNRSPILSDDMSIVFSSNKESTQESKRKRSPSPNSLDNNELQAIASNWCDDAGDPSPRRSTPLKKLRIATERSPVSIDSDDLPVVHPLAIYGSGKRVDGKMKSTEKTNSELLNIGESMTIDDLDEAVRQFDNIDENIQTERRNNLKDIDYSSDKNRDSSMKYNIKRGNSFSGSVDKSINKNSATLIKAKSLEDRNSSSTTTVGKGSGNSDKENEFGMRNEGERRKESDNKEAATIKGRSISSKGEIKRLERIEEENKLRNSSKDVQEPLESSFDRDMLNITQEEILMQEIADNLLGRNSRRNDIEEAYKGNEIVERTPRKSLKRIDRKEKTGINNAGEKMKSCGIAKNDTEDSDTMDEEEIIESTPDKNSAIKKDRLNSKLESSQRSNASLRSFMSMNITPIPKSKERNLQIESNVASPLEPGSKSLINDERLRQRKPYHSTPKAENQLASSSSSRSNLLRKTLLPSCSKVLEDDEKKEKLCLVGSCLSLPQVQMVKEFACKYYAEYTASYNETVTHVIVETNETDAAARTLKYLFGIADKKWIVSFKWVEDSMRQNKILKEEDYEAVDRESGEPGPRRSRLSQKPLFTDFAFVCMKPFGVVTIEQMQGLISRTGGIAVSNLEDLRFVDRKCKLILYDSDFHDVRKTLTKTTFDNWRKKGNALPVMLEWVLSCISQYNLVSIHNDLQLDPDILSEFDLPASVIAEEDEDEEEETTAVDDST